MSIKKQIEHKTVIAMFVGNLPWIVCAAIMAVIAVAEAVLIISLL